MTDGSGINHVEYDCKMPTVWAIKPGRAVFLSLILTYDCQLKRNSY